MNQVRLCRGRFAAGRCSADRSVPAACNRGDIISAGTEAAIARNLKSAAVDVAVAVAVGRGDLLGRLKEEEEEGAGECCRLAICIPYR